MRSMLIRPSLVFLISAVFARAAPPTPLADPSGIDKSRFISFSIPTSEVVAIRVKLVSLHHVNPPYSAGPFVPFTTFEGQDRWVGPPTQYVESVSSGTLFYASKLQCAPHYQDWSTVGLLHVTGSEIVPSSSYEVENLAANCAGNEGGCSAVSVPLQIATTRWGDVVSAFQLPTPPATQPDFTDIGAMVNKFKSAPGAPIKARAMLAGYGLRGLINITPDLGFGHISACVDAFKGLPYWYAGPAGNETIANVLQMLGAMNDDLAGGTTPLETFGAEPKIGVPTVATTANDIVAVGTIDFFQGYDVVASGTSTVTVDFCTGEVSLETVVSDGATTWTLVQSVSLNADILSLWGFVQVNGGAMLPGGWDYSTATGAVLNPGSDPAFAGEVESMFQIAPGSTAAATLSAGAVAGAVSSILQMIINYIKDQSIPYTPPVSCLGPKILNGSGQSCAGVNILCANRLAEMCTSINDLPNVSIAFKKCMKGRCGCGGSNHKRLEVACDFVGDCGVCPSYADGCNLPGGSRMSYCEDMRYGCTCANLIFHEMSHGCGTNDRKDGSAYDAYRIGTWFQEEYRDRFPGACPVGIAGP